MSETKFYILPSDRAFMVKRIAELEKEIQNLGPDFHVALNQSTETWHDNAPFDVLRDKQAGFAAELQSLRRMLRAAAPSPPKPKKGIVGIGSVVTFVEPGGREASYCIAGDWTSNAGKKINNATIVSVNTPLAQALINKKSGDVITIPPHGKKTEIKEVDQDLITIG